MLLLPLAIVGCTKDNILTQTLSTGDNTTPASTVDVPTDDEDDVDGTNFVVPSRWSGRLPLSR